MSDGSDWWGTQEEFDEVAAMALKLNHEAADKEIEQAQRFIAEEKAKTPKQYDYKRRLSEAEVSKICLDNPQGERPHNAVTVHWNPPNDVYLVRYLVKGVLCVDMVMAHSLKQGIIDAYDEIFEIK